MRAEPDQDSAHSTRHAALETPPRIPPDVPFLEWSKGEVNQTIAQRFENQVAQYPQRIAIRSAGTQTTYDELNRRANRVAHALLKHDGQLGERVALLLNHDAPQMAAILGVLKAGRICLVLAASHPEARLAEILENAEADVLLTDANHLVLAEKLGRAARNVINVDALDKELGDHNPQFTRPPDTSAFIIYTSGSTGRPRGVLQTHRNVLHNIRRHTHGLRLHAGDRICLLSSCSAGQGMATMFCALLNGATLCPRDLAEESVAGLADWLIREEITVYVSAATVFRHFVGTLAGHKTFPHLRVVRLASEPVHQSDFNLFRRHFAPHCIFVNTYSSTETGNLCQFLLNQEREMPGDTMPIGYPVEDVEILLLDDNGRPVEAGAVGEIVAKSRYLSPGYWNDPEQTRAAFASVPGSEERIYRTRDLGRMRPDGLLEHRGRADMQVKIRGFRVYPDEVKKRLCQHSGVSDALVDSRTDPLGNSRLVAYIIPVSDRRPTPAELRRFAKDALPDFMVPSAYALLDVFPRTPNGKVDRTALRELKVQTAARANDGTGARTAVEELLAGAWAEVLNLDSVGIHDSFFELGGDSLLVTQLVFRIHELLNVEVSPALLFEKPTVAELIEVIEQRKPGTKNAGLPPIIAVSRERPLPLSFTQERNWRHSQSHRDSLSNLLSNGYILDGALNVDALQRSLDEIVRRHEPLRTKYSSGDNGLVQIIGQAEPVMLRVIDLERHPRTEEEADSLWWEEARCPVDLECGPMLRATLLRLNETRHWLLLTVHHIISDAWSRDNLLRDLGVLYAAFSDGRPSPLPDPALHCGDFAVWQRQLLRRDGETYQTQLDYWKRQLTKSPPKLDLPFKNAAPPPNPDFRTGRLRWSIPPELSRQLQTIGRQEGATLFMTRLAAFATHLHDITGADDIVIGSYMTNRTRPETERMIGFFSNLVMLRIDLTGNPTFRELLGRVRKTTLEAAAHSDIPFDELCADLKREKIRPPKIQIIFEVKYGETSLRFGDLEVRRMERKTATMPWGFQLSVLNKGDQTQGFALFDASIYDPAAVSKTISALQSLMEKVAANPEQRLSELRTTRPKRRWFFGF